MKSVAVIVGSLIINLGLFQLMESMISRDTVRLVEVYDAAPIEFVRSNMEEETRTKDRRTPPPPKPQEIDRPQADVQNIAQRASSLPADFSAFEVTSLMGEGGGVALGASLAAGGGDSLEVMMADDLIPLTLLPPQYPPSARARRIEGWVDLIFTVQADGTVVDPEVIESEPPEIFDRAAQDAARRWRFRPVMKDGRPADILAQIHINFSLQQ